MTFARFCTIVVVTAVALADRAHGFAIIPTFDSTITTNANAVAYEAAINTAVNTIDSLYGNPGIIQVLFEFNSGVHGQSNDGVNTVNYATYVSALAANSAAHPSNLVLATALANISKGNTSSTVIGTTAFLRTALGFAGATPCFDASGSFHNGCGQIFDGIISIGNLSTASNGPGKNSQAVSVLEHELDEVLGGGGTGTTLGTSNQSAAIGPTDPYRFHATGSNCASVTSTPSFTTSGSEVSCYSIDGGKTTLVQLNQAGGGSDFGDFANVAVNIQDAFDPGATNVYSYSSPEFEAMESIGYDIPEPDPLALMFVGLVGLTRSRHRRT
jgi:hypothetical protein